MDNQPHIEMKSLFRKEFVLFLLRNGKTPVTVYAFCEEIGVQEQEFYKYYSNFKTLEKDVWNDMFENVNGILQADENFPEYTSYEKWLSFLYTLIEEFKANRSYVLLRCENLERKEFRPWFLDGFRQRVFALVNDVVNQGLETDEIATRPVITSKYNEVLWVQFLYVLRVWVNDESEDFQVTDAAIEKTSVMLFEMMKKGPIDMLIDFVKFAYQNKAY
jgi:hypothetical protein